MTSLHMPTQQRMAADLQGRDAQLALHAASGDHELHSAQSRLPLELARRLQLAVLFRESVQRCCDLRE
jgi:hypothetical protein